MLIYLKFLLAVMMNTQKLLLEFLRPDQSGEIYGADNFPPPYRDQISSPYSRAGNFFGEYHNGGDD